MPQKLPKPLILSVLCYVLVLIALVALVVAGVITPRAFGILCAIAMALPLECVSLNGRVLRR
jgi:hypothetical protein